MPSHRLPVGQHFLRPLTQLCGSPPKPSSSPIRTNQSRLLCAVATPTDEPLTRGWFRQHMHHHVCAPRSLVSQCPNPRQNLKHQSRNIRSSRMQAHCSARGNYQRRQRIRRRPHRREVSGFEAPRAKALSLLHRAPRPLAFEPHRFRSTPEGTTHTMWHRFGLVSWRAA